MDMRRFHPLIVIICLLPSAGFGQTPPIGGIVEGMSDDRSEIQLFETKAEGCPKSLSLTTMKVVNSTLKDGLKKWKPCDRMTGTTSVDKNTSQTAPILVDYLPESKPVPVWERIVALAVSAFVLFGFTAIFSRFKPIQLLFVGADNRYSNSKTQMVLWFGITISGYVAAVSLRLIFGQWNWGVGIPSNLLMLSGLSGLSFASAKGITTKKTTDSQAALAINPTAPQKTTAASPRFPLDLLQDDNGQFDFGDYQMILITLIALVSYCILLFRFLGIVEMYSGVSLPDVDTTVLGLFGVGQGAYLTKKALSDINH